MNLYLLLSLIFSEGVSSLGEVRQAQEVHHLSLSIDECGEDGCIPKRGAIKASKLQSCLAGKSESRLAVLDS